MFVWIPRYSYKIVGTGNIDVSFLQGTTDREASGVEGENAVGVSSENTSATASVRVVPGVQSWRYITIGEAQYKSMQMSSNTTANGILASTTGNVYGIYDIVK